MTHLNCRFGALLITLMVWSANTAAQDVEPIPPTQRPTIVDGNVDDPLLSMTPWLDQVGAPEVWSQTTGEGVIVAIVDTGIDYLHEDLRDALFWTEETPGQCLDINGNGFLDERFGWDFVDGDDLPMDIHGHGTWIAGLIAAVADNGVGMVGVAPGVKILPIRVMGNEGNQNNELFAAAIDFAVASGAHIINASFGGWGEFERSEEIRNAIDRAGEAGVLFITGAGNHGEDVDRFPHYPGDYHLPNIIRVGGVEIDGTGAGFSAFGVMAVDVLAPAVELLGPMLDDRYEPLDGTSGATAITSGVAALLLSRFPNDSPETIIGRLMGSTDRNLGTMPLSATGLINAAEALSTEPLPARVTSIAISDADGDGVAEPGEDVELFPQFQWLIESTDSIEIRLTSGSEGTYEALVDVSTIPAAPLGDSVTLETPLTVRVSEDLRDAPARLVLPIDVEGFQIGLAIPILPDDLDVLIIANGLDGLFEPSVLADSVAAAGRDVSIWETGKNGSPPYLELEAHPPELIVIATGGHGTISHDSNLWNFLARYLESGGALLFEGLGGHPNCEPSALDRDMLGVSGIQCGGDVDRLLSPSEDPLGAAIDVPLSIDWSALVIIATNWSEPFLVDAAGRTLGVLTTGTMEDNGYRAALVSVPISLLSRDKQEIVLTPLLEWLSLPTNGASSLPEYPDPQLPIYGTQEQPECIVIDPIEEETSEAEGCQCRFAGWSSNIEWLRLVP